MGSKTGCDVVFISHKAESKFRLAETIHLPSLLKVVGASIQ